MSACAVHLSRTRLTLTKNPVVTWNVDSGDADGDSVSHSLNTYKSTYTKYPAPFMALNHGPSVPPPRAPQPLTPRVPETYKTTAKKVVPVVVPKLLAAGYKLVTVAQCLGDPHPYQQTGTPAVRDASWTCKGELSHPAIFIFPQELGSLMEIMGSRHAEWEVAPQVSAASGVDRRAE